MTKARTVLVTDSDTPLPCDSLPWKNRFDSKNATPPASVSNQGLYRSIELNAHQGAMNESSPDNNLNTNQSHVGRVIPTA